MSLAALRPFIVIHLGLTLLISLAVLVFHSPAAAVAILVGGALVALNGAGLGWAWVRILNKKSIAWTVVVIVIKYAFVLGIVSWVVLTGQLAAVPLGLGISLLAPSAVVFTFVDSQRQG